MSKNNYIDLCPCERELDEAVLGKDFFKLSQPLAQTEDIYNLINEISEKEHEVIVIDSFDILKEMI